MKDWKMKDIEMKSPSAEGKDIEKLSDEYIVKNILSQHSKSPKIKKPSTCSSLFRHINILSFSCSLIFPILSGLITGFVGSAKLGAAPEDPHSSNSTIQDTYNQELQEYRHDATGVITNGTIAAYATFGAMAILEIGYVKYFKRTQYYQEDLQENKEKILPYLEAGEENLAIKKYQATALLLSKDSDKNREFLLTDKSKRLQYLGAKEGKGLDYNNFIEYLFEKFPQISALEKADAMDFTLNYIKHVKETLAPKKILERKISIMDLGHLSSCEVGVEAADFEKRGSYEQKLYKDKEEGVILHQPKPLDIVQIPAVEPSILQDKPKQARRFSTSDAPKIPAPDEESPQNFVASVQERRLSVSAEKENSAINFEEQEYQRSCQRSSCNKDGVCIVS